MPPKKRGTRTRTALQGKQPVKQEQKEEGLASTKRANETSPDDKSRDDATTGPTLSDRRLRVRTVAASEGGKQSSAKASKAKDTTAKGKKAGTKGKKMASRGVTRKRTKKAAASTAGTYIVGYYLCSVVSRDVSCDRPRVLCDLHLQMVEPMMERMKKRRLRISRHRREEEMPNPLKVSDRRESSQPNTSSPGEGGESGLPKIEGASLVWRLSCVELIIAHLRGWGQGAKPLSGR